MIFKKNSIEKKVRLLQDYKDSLSLLLHQFVDEIIPSESSISTMMKWQFDTGGKKIRASLPFIVASHLQSDPETILPWAAACEVLHNASLVYDDIQDNDSYRRGQPSAWKYYGVESAINLGCTMMYCAPLLMKKLVVDDTTRWKLASLLMCSTIALIDGQEQDIKMRSCNVITFNQYYQCVKGKTAELLSLSLLGAAILCGVSQNRVDRLRESAEYIGVAFQILDDITDIFGKKMREHSGKDIVEGKRSILLVYCLETSSTNEKQWLLSILNKPSKLTTLQDINDVTAFYRKSGADLYARQLTRDYIKKALVTAGDDEVIRNIIDSVCHLIDNHNLYDIRDGMS